MSGSTGGSAHGDKSRLQITADWTERVVVLAVSGDVDMLSVPALNDAIQAAVQQQPAALIVDFTEVGFLGSAGMNLMTATKSAVVPAMRFGVVADGPATSRPLKVLGLDKVFALYATLDDAVADLTAS